MKSLRAFLGAVVLVSLAAVPAQAQRFGAQVSWADDFDLGLGARAEFPLAGVIAKQGAFSRAALATSVDFFFPDCNECSYLEVNGNVIVPVTAQTLRPYLGAGLNVARVSVDAGAFGDVSDTEVGLNLLGGFKFGLGDLSAFSEARLEVGGGEQLVLTFGFLFGGAR